MSPTLERGIVAAVVVLVVSSYWYFRDGQSIEKLWKMPLAAIYAGALIAFPSWIFPYGPTPDPFREWLY
jgi:hypothetical protein